MLAKLEEIQAGFGKPVSLADLIVLGGTAAVEKAAADGGVDVEVPFTPGRVDATEEQTDADSFAALEPTADGFRNYLRRRAPPRRRVPAARPGEPAHPERAGADRPGRRPARPRRQPDGSALGVLTDRPGTLTNDFFVNLLDLGTSWTASGDEFEGRDDTGDLRWTGTRADLVFGSNSELRALAEVYASDDAREKFVRDFVAAWAKVMDLDRFDV